MASMVPRKVLSDVTKLSDSTNREKSGQRYFLDSMVSYLLTCNRQGKRKLDDTSASADQPKTKKAALASIAAHQQAGDARLEKLAALEREKLKRDEDKHRELLELQMKTIEDNEKARAHERELRQMELAAQDRRHEAELQERREERQERAREGEMFRMMFMSSFANATGSRNGN